MNIGTALVCLLVVFSASRCAHNDYLYMPSRNVNAVKNDAQATSYPIYSGAREGSVRVASYGIQDIQPKKDAEKVRALHLRLTASNDLGKGNMKINTRDLLVTFPGRGKSRPAYVEAQANETLPTVTVAPGQTQAIDLYYPLPEDMKSAGKIPDFTFDWRIETPDKEIANRTDFQRIDMAPNVPAYTPGPGLWYDPFYSDMAFGPAGWF